MGKLGGTATVCMNAANEEAVFAFLDGKIKLYDIYEITKRCVMNIKLLKILQSMKSLQLIKKFGKRPKNLLSCN